MPWLGGVIAAGLLVFKVVMLVRLFGIGLPIPTATGARAAEEQGAAR
jgi:hypothetical protein